MQRHHSAQRYVCAGARISVVQYLAPLRYPIALQCAEMGSVLSLCVQTCPFLVAIDIKVVRDKSLRTQ
jgi:hypothetical protein